MRRRLLIPLIIALSVSWSSALAQTATPTPFFVPATPTSVPVGGGFGQNGAFWICTLYQDANAWYCRPTNNGNFSFNTSAEETGSGPGVLKHEHHRLIVPSDVTGVTLFCAYAYAGGESHQNASFSGGTQSQGGSSGSITRFGTWSYTQDTGTTIYGASRVNTTTGNAYWQAEMQTLPAGIAPSNQQAGLGWRTSASAAGVTTGGVPHTAYAQSVVQCQIQSYSTGSFPQNWIDERTPTPVPTLTPVPTGTPTPNPWAHANAWPTAVAWSAPTPVPVSIGLTPGSRVCTTIIPGFTFGPYTLFGYELGASWDAVIVCNTNSVVAWSFLGIDIGGYMLVLLTIGAIGVFYSRMR